MTFCFFSFSAKNPTGWAVSPIQWEATLARKPQGQNQQQMRQGQAAGQLSRENKFQVLLTQGQGAAGPESIMELSSFLEIFWEMELFHPQACCEALVESLNP